MPGGVQGGHAVVAVAHGERGGLRAGDRVHAEHPGLQVQVVDQEAVAFVQVGRALPELLQLPGGAHVVEMGVAVQQRGHLEAQGGHPPGDPRAFPARVHHDAGERLRVPEQGAVAAQGADREAFQFEHAHS